ncbi:A-kinase anchor protein 8-like [Denticeps clupeoides]|uniref:C2H2 AKAP95-type domain-containing protein n=1 Tax=Denticeps clupeoides TaxID=299321 RepID=A0AAY4A081_9TELE|nr:A-kinase anchor protein 8-like [Denticeps clupeoides]
MDGRGYGFSSWGGGGGSSSRGSGNYDLYGGFKDSMAGGSSFGGGGFGGGGQMKRNLSGGGLFSSTGTSADAVIAKINQRLDMLSQLEGGSRGDRFGQYESFDSRPSSLGPRDLFRSGNYGYSDVRGDMMGQRGGIGYGAGGGAGVGGGGDFDGSSSFGSAKMRPTPRDAFSGSGWGAGQRSPRRAVGLGSRGFVRRQDNPPMSGGGRGGARSPGGRGKLPSLLGQRMYPDSGVYQMQHGPQDFSAQHFGGGPRGNRQRGRKRPLNRQQKTQREGQKKRKKSQNEADEPESKACKTETAATDVAEENTEATEKSEESQEAEVPAGTSKDSEEGGEKALTIQDEISQIKQKLQGKKPQQQPQQQQPPQQQPQQAPTQEDGLTKVKKRNTFFLKMGGVKFNAQRMMFACSICKFRSFYSEDMAVHLESKFHKDHFKFLASQLSKPTTDFLQEYLVNRYKKTEQRISQIDNFSEAICQVYREQDLTRDIGMNHFMKKVEAAHCAACDLFIPMQFYLIKKHLRSPDHNYNCKAMMDMSKVQSLSVARSILNHKIIGKKLESYLNGENPFIGNPDDQDPEDSMVMDGSEAELAGENVAETGVKKEEEEEEALEGNDTNETETEGAEKVAEADVKVEEGEECIEGMSAENGDEQEAAVEEGVELGEEEAAEDCVKILDEIDGDVEEEKEDGDVLEPTEEKGE